MLSWQRGMGAELLAAPVQMPVPAEVTLGGAGPGVSGMVFHSRDDTPHSALGSCYSITEDEAVPEVLSA